MSRPKREISMARCAASAMLAAIEVYNKPTVEYREQTFALLMVNAWEVLLKARLVQQAGGKIEAIYRRENNSRRYRRHPQIKEPITLGLGQVLARADLPAAARDNIIGLEAIRNRAAHLGMLTPKAARAVLAFGTAGVQNFQTMSLKWFGEAPEVPHLLPVGFLGDAKAARQAVVGSQRELLNLLAELSSTSDSSDSECAVVMHIDVQVNRGFSGGGTIGLTSDPNAPRVRMTVEEAMERFPTRYFDLITLLRSRYTDFKQNQQFNDHMKIVNADPQCAFERLLDPLMATGQKKRFYSPQAVFEHFDSHYTRVSD